MNERPDLYEYQQTIFKRFNMKKNLEEGGTRAKFGQSELLIVQVVEERTRLFWNKA